jgi:hypothetical protein
MAKPPKIGPHLCSAEFFLVKYFFQYFFAKNYVFADLRKFKSQKTFANPLIANLQIAAYAEGPLI